MPQGKLYGIGVGPGDPELMTIKAVRAIEAADVLILPARDRESCRAYRIAANAVSQFSGKTDAGIDGKECIFEPFPMKMDKDELAGFHKRVSERICGILSEGRNAAFLTIGDPSVYSTFTYVAALVEDAGFGVERIAGVTSFCAAAARLGIPLGEGDAEIHIIPGSADAKAALGLGGTKVFMKSGSRLGEFISCLKEHERDSDEKVYAVSNCGLKNEEAAYSADGINHDAGYMTTVIVTPDKSK